MPAHDIDATAIWNFKTVIYSSNGAALTIDASHEYHKNYFDISSLRPFMNDNYELTFELLIEMREIKNGYQEIYLANSSNKKIASIGDNFSLNGGTLKDDWTWKAFTFKVSGAKCSDEMHLIFGGHGEGSDDWRRDGVEITVTVREKT